MAESQDEIIVRRVRVGDFPGIGDEPIDMHLSSERTVLVGKNGAGKSLLMAAAFHGARTAWTNRISLRVGDPTIFEIEIGTSGAPTLKYTYRLIRPELLEQDQEPSLSSAPADGAPVGPPIPAWFEQCLDGNGVELWRVADSQLIVSGAEPLAVPKGIGVLGLGRNVAQHLPDVAFELRRALNFQMVSAGLPRDGTHRHFVIVKARKTESRRIVFGPTNRVERLAASIARAHEHGGEIFEEFAEIVRRLRFAKDVSVVWFDPPQSMAEHQSETWAAIAFDNLNIGYWSDGTLRACEIILALVSGGGVLFIEEAETGIHPGLLETLLQIIESYSKSRQVVMSTHSPYVLNRCAPADLRLVERFRRTTTIRSLNVDEVKRVERYLHDDGLLDEYIFSPSDPAEDDGDTTD